ncbi:MAG TPA: hypothetical protein VII22_09260 [Streptosporangiaceae bacterium]
MNGREMNDSSGRGRDRRRSWPRWAAALAAMALTGLLVTACGGGSSPAASATGGSTREQAALAYARCMRSHGVPGFPDPDSNGNFHLGNNQQGGGSKGSGSSSGGSQESNSVSSQETAANQVCNHLLNVGTQLDAAQTQHALRQLVKYAQCMRAHGVPNFRDPHTTNGGIGVPSGFGFDMTGIDMHSPQFQSAEQACQSLATHAKG